MSERLAPLPEAFEEQLSQLLPVGELAGCLATFALDKPTAFRVNSLKSDPAAVQTELTAQGFRLQPVAWYEAAFLVSPDQRRALTESAAFAEGRIYIQNLSSMIAPLVLAPRPGETVLDLAAAPGGKTLQLAGLMANQGRLVAVDSVKNRFYKLKANLERGGAGRVETYLMDGRAAGRRWPEIFDRVLLDAPCSSEARFYRRDPQSWAHWSPRKVKESAHKQRRMLQAAFYSLKPGGRLLYCTCSFAPEENEIAIDHLLRKFGGELQVEVPALPVAPIQPGLTQWGKKSLHPDLSRTSRILPGAEMDGFYLALLRKQPAG
jgi:tRNA (cytosine49-C5)-methyltransferase